ncbi:tRNA-specific adenosine deaminase subunit [Scheffersomyces xylosifermentans]|uniref:tRNA-specific adenosine deaminase subunit n=1 Tax=Scheffersomyces xylosifermentans TaxID=1304137 RepID=UPI00315C864F
MSDLTPDFIEMAKCLFVGYKALTINETPVSCLLEDRSTSSIISIGYNYTNTSLNGTKHAEFIAVRKLKDKNPDIDFSTVKMYVSVEPCIMCASFLRQLGIGEVIYGCSNDRFGGNGTVLSVHSDSNLPQENYTSYGGILRTEAIQLLRNFYIQENESAPQPKIKKNKEIENKTFPPNRFNLSREEFIDHYGVERIGVFESGEEEITPKLGKGYSLKEFIDLKSLKDIPYLEEDLGVVTEDQVNEFLDLFFDISDDGKVNYSKAIRKFNSKKRHLEE